MWNFAGLTRNAAIIISCHDSIAILGGVVAVMQWTTLYRHYFVKGYALTTSSQTATAFVSRLPYRIGFLPLFVLGSAYLLCCFGISDWKQQRKAVAVTGWVALGFPLIMIGLGTFTPSFYSEWSVLLLLPLSALIPSAKGKAIGTLLSERYRFSYVLLIVSLCSFLLQYVLSTNEAHALA